MHWLTGINTGILLDEDLRCCEVLRAHINVLRTSHEAGGPPIGQLDAMLASHWLKLQNPAECDITLHQTTA